jgi:RimJ/RimL family protein N-acetyltransferase
MDTNTQEIVLRRINEADYGEYLQLQKEVFLGDIALCNDGIRKTWASMFELDRVAYAIVTDDNNAFCGYCAVKNIQDEKPEIEIELLRKYRGKGIGFQALGKMMTEVGEQENISCFIAAVESDNHISQKLMCKLGGVPGGIRKSIYLEEKSVKAFEIDNLDLLDSRISHVAETFGVEAIKLLSHVLLFGISLDSLTKALTESDSDRGKKNAGYIDDTNRKVSAALRRKSRSSIANEVLTILNKYSESDFDEAKAEVIAYLNTRSGYDFRVWSHSL